MEPLAFKNIRFVPSIHQRIAFADEVRRAASEFEPDCIAVEFPPFLKEWIVRGVLRLPQISCVSYPSPADAGQMLYVPIDPCDSLIEAVRIALEREIPIAWIDEAPGTLADWSPILPDDLMVERVGLERYVDTLLPYLADMYRLGPAEQRARDNRDLAMAASLAGAALGHERVLCVLGLAHYAGVRRLLPDATPIPAHPSRTEGAFFAHVHPKSVPEIVREIPYVAYLRETRRDDTEEANRFDKLSALRKTLKRAERKYRDEYKAEINLTRAKALYQFTRNLALTQGKLQPETYELVMGAKGCVDGDYGYEVYEMARSYPLQDEGSSLPTLTLNGGRGTFSDRDEKFRMTPLFGEQALEKIKIRFRRRPPLELREKWKEDWKRFNMRGICSWPPEDERQEKFMTHVRKRALKVVSEDKKQVVEFTSSILDGLDIRETTRNWHSKKIYVQRTPQPQGKVGGVVLIFDNEVADERYSWRCTLYAENQNESDISFYATPLGENVVGPRICKTEFGGILSIYPSTRIPDIWSFPILGELTKCSDILLAAAFLFSQDRYVAYVAAKPPSSLMKNLASRYKKHIIYLPLGGFSPAQIKKVRMFHILSGHDVRGYAADYIFDE